MVILQAGSQFDVKTNPFLHQWDQDMRQNHKEMQEQIDRHTYHLQRSQRGLMILGEWAYPKFFQKDLLALEVYKTKQLVGKIYQEEVQHYKKYDANIADSLNKTFNSQFPWPKYGFIGSCGLLGFAQVFNFAYSFRLAFVVVPLALDVFLQLGDKKQYFKSLEFLNWLQNYRVCKSRLELDTQKLNQYYLTQYKAEFKSQKPLQDLYNDLVTLVQKNGNS